MPVRLGQHEIDALLRERKQAPNPLELRLREKRGHEEQQFEITGESSSQFRVILRQSAFNPADFSAILAYAPPRTNELFRLRRYNGRHWHTNRLERQDAFYDFHIHQATDRYQEAGGREDEYAEATRRYGTLEDAFNCLLDDCNVEQPPKPQLKLL